jgi:uncharacterized protein YdaU (DUF1376 family)
MPKAPAFQHYAADFYMDTVDWPVEDLGIFHRLLEAEWVNGGLPTDEVRLARIAGCGLKKFQKGWRSIAFKFHPICDGQEKVKLINDRMEEVRKEQREWRENQAISGRSGGQKTQEKRRKKSSEPSSEPSSVNEALQSSSSSSPSSSSSSKRIIPVLSLQVNKHEGKIFEPLVGEASSHSKDPVAKKTHLSDVPGANDPHRLAALLRDGVLEENPVFQPATTLDQEEREVKSMIEGDHRKPGEIEATIKWITGVTSDGNEFWQTIIKDASLLRKHFNSIQGDMREDFTAAALDAAPPLQAPESKSSWDGLDKAGTKRNLARLAESETFSEGSEKDAAEFIKRYREGRV